MKESKTKCNENETGNTQKTAKSAEKKKTNYRMKNDERNEPFYLVCKLHRVDWETITAKVNVNVHVNGIDCERNALWLWQRTEREVTGEKHKFLWMPSVVLV